MDQTIVVSAWHPHTLMPKMKIVKMPHRRVCDIVVNSLQVSEIEGHRVHTIRRADSENWDVILVPKE